MLLDRRVVGLSREVSRCDYKQIARNTGKTEEEIAAWALSHWLAETLVSCEVFEGESFTLKDAYSVTTLVVGRDELEDMLDALELRDIVDHCDADSYRLTPFGRVVAKHLS